MKAVGGIILSWWALLLATGLGTPPAHAQTKDPLKSWRMTEPALASTGDQELLRVGGRLVLAGAPSALISPDLVSVAQLPLIERFDSAARRVAFAQSGTLTVLVFRSFDANFFDPRRTTYLVTSADGIVWKVAHRESQTALVAGPTLALHNGAEFVVYLGERLRVRSPDGATWSREITDDLPSAITYQTDSTAQVRKCGAAWFLFGGGNILRSSDGLRWTDLGVAAPSSDIPASNGALLALGPVGRVLVSSDAVTWTATDFDDGQPRFGPRPAAALFAAEGRFFRRGPGPNNLRHTSTDGVNWTPVADPMPGRALRVGAGFVGSDSGGNLFVGDGLTWTRTFSPYDPTRGPEFSGDGLVLRWTDNVTGTKAIAASRDGGPFLASNLALVADDVRGLARIGSSDTWVVATSGGKIHSSTDGRNWSQTFAGASPFTGIVAAHGRAIVSGPAPAVTGDGLNWSVLPDPINHAVATEVGFACVRSTSDNRVFFSNDGLVWRESVVPTIPEGWGLNIAHGLGATFAASSWPNLGGVFFRTTDGTTWSALPGLNRGFAIAQQTGFLGTDRALYLGREDGLFATVDADRWTMYREARSISGLRSECDVLGGYLNLKKVQARFILPRPGLSGLSTRGFVGAGGEAMIAGFVITGDRPRQVLLRGGGPTIATYGVSGTLADPEIELVRMDGPHSGTLATNDNWRAAANADEIAAVAQRLGEFPFPADSKDAALVLTLEPGVYTLQVRGRDGGTGVALAEVYDAEASPADTSDRRIVALSTRLTVKSGDSVAIAGLIVQGTRAKQILLRGLGPELARFGVPGVLAKPRLSLHHVVNGAEQLVHTSARWADETNAPDLAVAFDECGVSALPVSGDDSAMLVELAPGAYTIHLASQDGASGTGLIEAYEVR